MSDINDLTTPGPSSQSEISGRNCRNQGKHDYYYQII